MQVVAYVILGVAKAVGEFANERLRLPFEPRATKNSDGRLIITIITCDNLLHRSLHSDLRNHSHRPSANTKHTRPVDRRAPRERQLTSVLHL
jgi:hypothetical protein